MHRDVQMWIWINLNPLLRQLGKVITHQIQFSPHLAASQSSDTPPTYLAKNLLFHHQPRWSVDHHQLTRSCLLQCPHAGAAKIISHYLSKDSAQQRATTHHWKPYRENPATELQNSCLTSLFFLFLWKFCLRWQGLLEGAFSRKVSHNKKYASTPE